MDRRIALPFVKPVAVVISAVAAGCKLKRRRERKPATLREEERVSPFHIAHAQREEEQGV
jgi:hypothetical protein